MRVNFAFTSIFNNRLVVRAGVAIVMLTIFLLPRLLQKIPTATYGQSK